MPLKLLQLGPYYTAATTTIAILPKKSKYTWTKVRGNSLVGTREARFKGLTINLVSALADINDRQKFIWECKRLKWKKSNGWKFSVDIIVNLYGVPDKNSQPKKNARRFFLAGWLLQWRCQGLKVRGQGQGLSSRTTTLGYSEERLTYWHISVSWHQ